LIPAENVIILVLTGILGRGTTQGIPQHGDVLITLLKEFRKTTKTTRWMDGKDGMEGDGMAR